MPTNHARRALISVSDKSGIVEFAQGLSNLGFEVISTGGTAGALTKAGVPITPVADVTGFPEMLDGRVKTLHPAIHGGLLMLRDSPDHRRQADQHGIRPIDLVCVNLYPFEATIARAGSTVDEAIENIDIGGPAMIRSAAKNAAAVTVVTDPADYGMVIGELRAHGDTLPATRRRLAALAYAHTAAYDSAISTYLTRQEAGESPDFGRQMTLGGRLRQVCRYGENPHQSAAFYAQANVVEPCIATARQISGRELSFNNIYDLNAALETAKEFADELQPAAVIVKHANPCGAAMAASQAEAFAAARLGDPVSAFGGILAVTRTVDASTAEEITGKNTFFEAIIAPGYDADAVEMLQTRKKWGANLRLLEVGELRGWREAASATGLDFKRVTGGFLVQDRDLAVLEKSGLTVVSQRQPTDSEFAEMLFAWRVVRHVKSNAIVLTADQRVVGVGAGQMNRVQSVRLAVGQAGEAARGSVMASDAFFPFPDGPEAAAEAGITAIIQPGGSVKDSETIAVANSYGIAMVFTGVRHFLH